MKTKKLFFAACVLLALAVFVFRPIYDLVMPRAETVTLIRHRGELFFFVGEKTLGWKGNGLQNLWRSIIGFASYETWNRKLILQHISQGIVKEQIYNEIDAGTPFFYQDELFYGSQSSLTEQPVNWRWDGKRLVRLSKLENDKINQASENYNNQDFTPRGDWLEKDCIILLSSNPPVASQHAEIKAGRITYRITMKQEINRSKTYWQSFELSQVGSIKPPVLLYQWSFKRKYISKQTYNKIIADD